MFVGLPDERERGDVLLEVALQLGSAPDLEQLLPLSLRRAAELLHADRALFALYDDAGRITRAVTHNLSWPGPPAPLPISSSLVNSVLETGETIVVKDSDPHELSMATSFVDMKLRFMMGVPVSSPRGIAGLIYADSTDIQVAIDPKLTEFLVALSRLIGMAVEQARLFEEQRFRRRLLGSLVHDLRTPLSVITANLELLRGGAEPEQVDEVCGDLEASCQRMARIVANTLELSLADEGDPQRTAARFGLEAALGTHLDALHAVAQQHGTQLGLQAHGSIGPVQAVDSWVWIIVDNLVFWGVRQAGEGGELVFSLSDRGDAGPVERVGDEIELFGRLDPFEPVAETGFVRVTMRIVGVQLGAHALTNLFRVRARAGYGSGQAVSGLGMSIVRQCARYLGGRAWAENGPEGIECHFTLPRELAEPARPLLSGVPLGIGHLLGDETIVSEMTLDTAPTLDET